MLVAKRSSLVEQTTRGSTAEKQCLTADFTCLSNRVETRDKEAVKFSMLPLLAPLEVLCFRVRFRFFTFEIFCFRFQLRIALVASEFASASSLFYQSASAYASTKNLTAASTFLLSMKPLISFGVKKKKQASLLCKLFYLSCVVDRAWYGMEDDFSVFHTGNFLPFLTKNLPFHTKVLFHIPFHTSIPKKF